MARRFYEKRSFGNALMEYLSQKGWQNVTYSEGNISDKAIAPPQIAVSIPTGNRKELQLGRTAGKDSTFRRIVQVDAYMENENRADTIIDDIMDFIDFVPVSIIDPAGDTVGTFLCENSESIFGETLPPITTDPRIGRWRGVVRAQMEAHYYDD